jgi:23S rRNA (uridine2552-2'-O)-methyltransferase
MSHLRKSLDFWAAKAKAEGFKARSVFKLQEIDSRHKLFRHGQRVLDLGASPGSWSQYAAGRVGVSGYVLALDLTPFALPGLPQVHTQVQDIFKWTPDPALSPFHVVLSDMMANTSGDKTLDADRSVDLCLRACELANSLLRPDGVLVVKIFQGRGYIPFFKTLKASYREVHTINPAASRSESKEVFLMGRGLLHPFSLDTFENNEEAASKKAK